MSALKSAARVALHQGGALGAIRYWRRREFRILMYHGFPPGEEPRQALEEQCDHIRRHYRPAPLAAIGRSLRSGTELPPHTLAVTVDDGYRDFLLNAWPVFARYDIPVTVYLVSDFCDRNLWLWVDQVQYMIRETARLSLEPAVEGAPARLQWHTPEERKKAAFTLVESMKRMPDTARLELLGKLPDLLAVELPQNPPAHLAALDWDEVRTLAAEGVEFGSHTKTHPILSRLEDRQTQRLEIESSRRRIEEELRRPIAHFCYPNGKARDYNADTLAVVKECGFETAVITESGLNNRAADRYQLRRLGVETNYPPAYFRELLAGLH